MNTTRLIRCAGPLGLYAVARHITRRHPRILMYHRFSDDQKPGYVSADSFEKQISFISKHYHSMTLLDLVDCLHKNKKIPPHAIVVTVDDGYRDFHDVAWPILRRHHVPATLFVTTGFVDQELWLWPDQIAWLLDNAEHLPDQLKVCEHTVSTTTSKATLWGALVQRLLGLPDKDKHTAIAVLSQTLGLTLPVSAPPSYQSVNWDQLRGMQAEGLEIGGHTHTHPTLPQVEVSALAGEIDLCLERMTVELGSQPRTFCYPNGQPSDFSKVVRDRVESAGFVGAVMAYADHTAHDDLYALRRHSSSENSFQFNKALSGLEWLGSRVKAKCGFL